MPQNETSTEPEAQVAPEATPAPEAKPKVRAKATKPALCLCGCGGQVKPRRRFLQGHDQRLRGQLMRGETKANSAALRAFVADNRELLAKGTKGKGK